MENSALGKRTEAPQNSITIEVLVPLALQPEWRDFLRSIHLSKIHLWSFFESGFLSRLNPKEYPEVFKLVLMNPEVSENLRKLSLSVPILDSEQPNFQSREKRFTEKWRHSKPEAREKAYKRRLKEIKILQFELAKLRELFPELQDHDEDDSFEPPVNRNQTTENHHPSNVQTMEEEPVDPLDHLVQKSQEILDQVMVSKESLAKLIAECKAMNHSRSLNAKIPKVSND